MDYLVHSKKTKRMNLEEEITWGSFFYTDIKNG